MKQPKISVIMPVYNTPKEFLREAIDSVIHQTLTDFELLIVDDGSTEETKEFLKQNIAGCKNIKVIFNNKNSGLAVSRNIGIKEANGIYIYFLDSDDTIAPNCLEILYGKIKTDRCDICMAGIEAYPNNKEDKFCMEYSHKLNDWLGFKKFDNLKITDENALEIFHTLHVCAVNKLYDRSFLIDNGIYFINKKCFHEDNGFWLKNLICNPSVSGIEEKTYFYRIRKTDQSQMKWEKMLESIN